LLQNKLNKSLHFSKYI